MVVLVDGAAHGAEGVVAVGHGVRDGELLQPAGLGGLDDADKGNVMGNERVELEAQFFRVRALVVGAENGVSDRLLPGFIGSGLPLGLAGGDDLAVQIVSALFDDFYHAIFPPFDSGGVTPRLLDLTA